MSIGRASVSGAPGDPPAEDGERVRLGSAKQAISAAFDALEAGLLDDVGELVRAQRRAEEPRWDYLSVMGAFPPWFRQSYSPRLCRQLFVHACALSRRWLRDEAIIAECLAEFLLLRWTLDRAVVAGWLDPGGPVHRSEVATLLGLCDARAASASAVSDSDPWGTGWSLGGLSQDPAGWFVPAIRSR